MAKLLPILIVAIAVLLSVEAESFKCWKKRQKAHQSPRENYLDYQLEQIRRENGIEVEKEPSDEECENERLGYNKWRSIAEQLYIGFLFIIVPVVIILMINNVKMYVASLSKYDSEGARPTRARSNMNTQQMLESCLMLKKEYIYTYNHIIMLENQRENSRQIVEKN